MKVCSEIRLEEDRSSVMNNLINSSTDSAAFNAKSSRPDSDKQNNRPPPACEHCKKPWHTNDQCWKLHVDHRIIDNINHMISQILDEHL